MHAELRSVQYAALEWEQVPMSFASSHLLEWVNLQGISYCHPLKKKGKKKEKKQKQRVTQSRQRIWWRRLVWLVFNCVCQNNIFLNNIEWYENKAIRAIAQKHQANHNTASQITLQTSITTSLSKQQKIPSRILPSVTLTLKQVERSFFTRSTFSLSVFLSARAQTQRGTDQITTYERLDGREARHQQ